MGLLISRTLVIANSSYTLVLSPSYLPGCTCVWLPATTHPHTPHTGVRPELPPRLHLCVVASNHPHTPHTGTHPIAVVPLRRNAVKKKGGKKKKKTPQKKKKKKKKKK